MLSGQLKSTRITLFNQRLSLNIRPPIKNGITGSYKKLKKCRKMPNFWIPHGRFEKTENADSIVAVTIEINAIKK
jgi:hypothetical protein